jgi:hypothetical protein
MIYLRDDEGTFHHEGNTSAAIPWIYFQPLLCRIQSTHGLTFGNVDLSFRKTLSLALNVSS